MDTEDRRPLLTLIERSESEPSRIVVAPHATGGRWNARRAIHRFGVALGRGLRKAIRMIIAAQPDDLLSFEPKRDKVVEGVLMLLERARDGGMTMTTETIATAMFLADKGHLDAFGRPVFFDNYVARATGPAGVAATEMLGSAFEWSTVGMDAAPWTLVSTGEGSHLRGARAPNLRRLSLSDLDALTSALAMVTSLDAEQLHFFTHRQLAYATAWENGEGARLDPRLIPEERDDELIDDLVYASRHAFTAPRRP